MVGSALVRQLADAACSVLPLDRSSADLRNQKAVDDWFNVNRPTHVFIAAARVGGIAANTEFPADFLYDNLMIEANIIHAAHHVNVEKLLFLGSSCIYPKLAVQPMSEDALLTGPLEPTNQWYAIAKIAGIKLAEAYRIQHGANFISGMPTNLYGPGDNYDLKSSHVLPALVRKILHAKNADEPTVSVWGSGTPLREFLHVDDCARASLFLMRAYEANQHVNIGSGEEISIADLAKLIANVAGYKGQFDFDSNQPDGTPRKLMDSSKLTAMGWKPLISLEDGVAQVIDIVSSPNHKLRAVGSA
jgi:GDP-L-fucose synthase